MPDRTIQINSFKYGLDTRREALASLPGTLQTAQNCHINSGGEIEKRKAFVLGDHLFPDNTFGLQDTDQGLVTFGSDAAPNTTLPTGITYQQLPYPYGAAITSMSAVLFSCSYLGKAFVLAKFNYSNVIFAYYNGALVGQVTDGIIKLGAPATPETLTQLGTDLAGIVNRINGWIGDANVAFDPTANIVPAANANYAASQDTATVVVGSLYCWTPGANEVSLVNGTTTLTAAGYFVAQNTLVTFNGTGPTVAYTGTLQLCTSYNEKSLAGSVLVMSPPGVHFTPSIPPERTVVTNSVAGVVGWKLIDQNYPGVPAQSAVVAFTLTTTGVNTGDTVTVTAPAKADGTGTAAVSGGAVVYNTSLSQTASDVAAAINNNTFITGYFAKVQGATVTVYAPASFGAFQNVSPHALIVDTTGNLTTTTGTAFSQVGLTVTIGNESIANFDGIRVVTRKATATITGLSPTGSATITWSQVDASNNDIASPANFFSISATTGATISIFGGLNPGVTSITGRFRCKVLDTGNNTTAILFFTVTMTAP